MGHKSSMHSLACAVRACTYRAYACTNDGLRETKHECEARLSLLPLQMRDLRDSLCAESEMLKSFSLIVVNSAWFVSTEDDTQGEWRGRGRSRVQIYHSTRPAQKHVPRWPHPVQTIPFSPGVTGESRGISSRSRNGVPRNALPEATYPRVFALDLRF